MDTEVVVVMTVAVVAWCLASARLDRRSITPALALIGLPLSVAVGVGLALAMFADLDVWVCAVIAAAVAPTDAALGAPLMADRRIPGRIRRELNVERSCGPSSPRGHSSNSTWPRSMTSRRARHRQGSTPKGSSKRSCKPPPSAKVVSINNDWTTVF